MGTTRDDRPAAAEVVGALRGARLVDIVLARDKRSVDFIVVLTADSPLWLHDHREPQLGPGSRTPYRFSRVSSLLAAVRTGPEQHTISIGWDVVVQLPALHDRELNIVEVTYLALSDPTFTVCLRAENLWRSEVIFTITADDFGLVL